MDSIMTFLKENYDLLSLAVGLIGVLVATLALYLEVKKKKRNKKK